MNLFPHQKEALELTKNMNRVAYYYDMGLGKTYIGSEKAISFGAPVILIVCQKSKIDDWIHHFKDNYDDIEIIDFTIKDGIELFLRDVNTAYNKHYIGVINYELAWRRTELLKLKNFTLVLDESSMIQNRKAKQTRFILKLHPENVILLSGTPCSGKYENLWTQAHLLGWDIKESTFQSTYVNWTTLDLGFRSFKIVDKKNPYKNVDRLKSKLREHGALFKLTEDCVELPEKVFQEISVPVIPAYKKFMKDCIVTVDDTELIGDTVFTKMLYARQLCGQYNKYKLNAVRDLMDSTNDRLIIFYNFNAELQDLKVLCDVMERPYSQVNGHCKDLTAYEVYDNSVTLCQYQAAAKGLNLQKANKIIYFTPTLKVEDWMQSQKRTHRIGQNSTCFYYMITCRDSIENRVYRALKRGTDYTEMLFEEEVKNVNVD